MDGQRTCCRIGAVWAADIWRIETALLDDMLLV
jgi:hypothetical protein